MYDYSAKYWKILPSIFAHKFFYTVTIRCPNLDFTGTSCFAKLNIGDPTLDLWAHLLSQLNHWGPHLDFTSTSCLKNKAEIKERIHVQNRYKYISKYLLSNTYSPLLIRITKRMSKTQWNQRGFMYRGAQARLKFCTQ